jgi:hypothetical protein
MKDKHEDEDENEDENEDEHEDEDMKNEDIDKKADETSANDFITRDVNAYNMNNDKKDLFSEIITDCKKLIRYEENKYDSLLLHQKPEASSIENNIDELIAKVEEEIVNLDKDIQAVRKDYTMIVNNMIQQNYKLNYAPNELQFMKEINSILKEFSEGYYEEFNL